MDINEEIKMGRLIIELNSQYKQAANSGNLELASELIEKLIKIKYAWPKLYEKTMLLT